MSVLLINSAMDDLIIDMKYKCTITLYLFYFILSFSNCETDEKCKNCTDKQTLSEFENIYLRFIVTDPKPDEMGGSFFHLDTMSNITTEFPSCVKNEYGILDDRKIIKANGRIFKPCEGETGLNYIKVDSYIVVDYCTPAFEIKDGQFALQSKWEVYSISSPDTILYVPCEAYPLGAYLKIDQNSFLGFSSANGFGGEINVKSSNEIELKIHAIGLFVGTEAENKFEEKFFKALSPNTLQFAIENNVLTIENPLNNYSIKLFIL